MKKINLILTILISILSLIGIIFLSVLISKSVTSDEDGDVIIEFLDLDYNIIKSKEIEFVVEDKLIDLIIINFENVTVVDGMIMSIEEYTTPSDWSTFISIYVDDEMSLVGINNIELVDGMKVSLIITEFIENYE